MITGTGTEAKSWQCSATLHSFQSPLPGRFINSLVCSMSDREEHNSEGTDQDQLSGSEDDAFYDRFLHNSSDDDENTRPPAQVSYLATGRELAGQDATATMT